jgi:Flp pilus assembly protein TadD
MRSHTILGVIVSGALSAGCGHEPVREAGATTPASSEMPVEVSSPAPVPVDPAAARAAWKDGVAKFESGDYTGSVPALQLAASSGSGDSYRSYLLGLAQWKSGNLEGAERSLVACVTQDPTRVKGFLNLARVRNERHDRRAALEAADHALALDPTSADALHQKGRALMELGRRDDALEALRTAHDLDADNGYIANTLGLLLIQAGRPQDAVAPLEDARTRLPHVAFVRNNLAVANERTGRIDDAKLEYQAAVEAGDMGGKAMKSLVRLGATDTTEPTVVTAATEPAKAE